MVKTKVQSEISTKEHPAGNFKSAEPEQPLHGQLQTQALPDAPSKLDDLVVIHARSRSAGPRAGAL